MSASSFGSDWLVTYLNSLRRDEILAAAQAAALLPLSREASEPESANGVVTVHEAATAARLALIGPAGAGKTTLLRQLAADAALSCLSGLRRGAERTQNAPIPLYIDLARYQGSLEATLATQLGPGAPTLLELAQRCDLLLLLDGLDRLPPTEQLSGLAAIGTTIASLQGRVRWVATCRSDLLGLFRPWLGDAQVYHVGQLTPQQVSEAIARSHGAARAHWLRDQRELAQLARRPRWLAAVVRVLQPGTTPLARGPLIAELVGLVLTETALDRGQRARDVLPRLAEAFDQAGTALRPAILAAHLPAVPDAPGIIRLLLDAGILIEDSQRSTVAFAQAVLGDVARALGLANTPPQEWPAASMTRPWREAVTFAYGLHPDRAGVLAWLLQQDAAELIARCLAETVPPDLFERTLAQSSGVTPGLRIRLADAFSQLGMQEAAIAQLEQAGADGYEETGLFRRLGDLYAQSSQWRHARVAYTQALLREPEDLRYRQRLGTACSRIGELAEAEAALQGVIGALRQIQAEAAAELGVVYATQGRLELALGAYQQAVAAQPGTPGYHRKMAATLHRLGRSAAAEDILRDLLSVHADDAEAHADLGRIYADTGRNREAIAALARAAALSPDEPRHYAQIGRLRVAAGDLSGARAAYQRAVQLSEHDPALQYAFAEVCAAEGDHLAALVAYRRAAVLDPQNAQALLRLGALLGSQGNPDEGVAVLREALALQPENAEIFAAIGQVLRQKGAGEQALDSYRQALALAPNAADYELGLGLTYQDLGRSQEAANHLARAIELTPERADLHAAIAHHAAIRDQWAVAAAAYERATEIDRHNPTYPREAATCQLQAGQYAAARRLLAEALRRDRHSPATWLQVGHLHASGPLVGRTIRALRRAGTTPEARDLLGRALHRAGQIDAAIASFAQALLGGRAEPETLEYYSRALADAGQIARAYDMARRALEYAGGRASLLQHASALARRLGRPHEALALVERALALDPGMAAAHAERGHLLLDQGQPEAALAAAQAALAQAPDLAQAAITAALALARLSRRDEARQMIEHALVLAPHDSEAHAARRDLLAHAEPAEALQSAKQAADLAPDEPEHQVRLGELFLQQQHADLAVAAFESALAIEPRLAVAHAWLSRAHAQRSAWPRARYHAEQARTLAPEHAEHEVLLAEALAGTGEIRAAARVLSDAIAQSGERTEWLHALGLLYIQAGDPQRGMLELRRAAQRDPQRAVVHRDLGRVLAEHGDPAESATMVARAIQLSPENAAWRADLAEIQIQRGWYAEALAELEQANALTPGDPRLLRLRAQARSQLGRMEEAQADLVAALRRGPNDLATLLPFTTFMLARHQYAAALGAARRAVALKPGDPIFLRLLAQALRASAHHQEAAEYAEQAAQIANCAPDWATAAQDWAQATQPDRAQHAWEQAIALAPRDAALRVRYGRFLLLHSTLDVAQAQLLQATELQPELAETHAAYAELLTLCQREAHADQAMLSARRATTLDPDLPAAWAVLGVACWQSGELAEASTMLQQARRLDPNHADYAGLLGLFELQAEHYSDALVAFESACQSATEVAAFQIGLAQALRAGREVRVGTQTNEPSEALRRAAHAIAQALQSAPRQPRWHFEAGLVAQLLGHHEQALDAFAALVDPHTTYVPAPAHTWAELITNTLGVPAPAWRVQLQRAHSLLACDQVREAASALDLVLEAQPAHADARELRGCVAAQQDDRELAVRLLSQVATLPTTSWAGHAAYGTVLIALGRPLDAIEPLERANALRPSDAALSARLAEAYRLGGRRERAIAAASKAARLDSRVAEYHWHLASLYSESGRLQEARAELMTAITLQPNQPDWHVQMSQICAGLGMREASANAVRKAIEIAPDQPSYRYELARLLADQGQEHEARTTLQEVVARAPERGEWRSELGRLYAHLGDHDSALSEYQAAVQYAPSEQRNWLALAEAQRRTVGPEAASETLERALARFGDDPDLHAAAGELFEQRGMAETATWHYRSAVEADTQRAEPWWRLGRAYMIRGAAREALAALDRALDLDPRAAAAHATKAQLLAESGDAQSAIYHGRTAAAISPDDTTILVWVGEALLKLRRFDDAYQLLGRAAARRPDDGQIMGLCGDAALASGREDAAVDAFERAMKAIPDDASLHYRAGLAHRRLKHYSRAIACFRRAIKLRANYGDAIRELSTLGPLAFFTQYGDQMPTVPDEAPRVDDLPPYERPDRRS